MSAWRPNVVLIMVDNMPAAAVGCYGNVDVHTPNLDRLAAQGIRFNHVYCANGVCSPSRASFFTGLMPSQHGVHYALPDQWAWYPANLDAVAGLRTLPQTLKDNGYKTALIGKFHLGAPYTPHLGFDYWVSHENGYTVDFWDTHYVEDGETHQHDGHATDLWTDKAIYYLRNHTGADRPFFLYLSYNAPYGVGDAMRGEPKMPFGEFFKDRVMDSAPDILPIMRNYFSQISHLDDGVGRVLKTLQELGLEDSTLVLFTADHGLSMGRNDLWGVSPHAFPCVGYRQCFNVPMIVRHSNHIRPLQVSDLMVMQTDWFRTLLDYIGLNDNAIVHSPGKSLAPLLKGEPLAVQFDAVFYEQEELRAIRTQRWAYFRYFPGSDKYKFADELYDLVQDPAENHNAATDSRYAAIVAELGTRIECFFTTYAKPKYDLWHGGTVMAYDDPPRQAAIWRDAFGPDWAPEYGP